MRSSPGRIDLERRRGRRSASTAPPARLHDRPHEREPDAAARRRPRAWSRSRARRCARAVRAARRRRSRETEIASAPPGAAANTTRTQRGSGPARRGIDRVVDQVAHDRHRVDRTQRAPRSGRVDLAPSTPRRARAPAPPCRAAGRRRSGRRRGVRRPGRRAPGSGGTVSVRMLDRLVGAAELEQRDGGVHAVAVLVGLRAQRLAERADRLVRRDGIPHRARRAGRRRCGG